MILALIVLVALTILAPLAYIMVAPVKMPKTDREVRVAKSSLI
jgi:hypothetical protein